MTWLAPNLKNRIRIQAAVETPNERGSFSMSYITVAEVWADFKPVSWKQTISAYVRGVQISDTRTHTFEIRSGPVKLIGPAQFANGDFDVSLNSYTGGLGRQFGESFNEDFDTRPDYNPLKSEYFIFLQRDGNWDRGRMFRVLGATDKNERREWIEIIAKELEEWGTGHNV